MTVKELKEFLSKCQPECDDLDIKAFVKTEDEEIVIIPLAIDNFLIKEDMLTLDRFFSIDVNLSDW